VIIVLTNFRLSRKITRMTKKIKEYKGSFLLAFAVFVTVVLSIIFFMFTAPVIKAF